MSIGVAEPRPHVSDVCYYIAGKPRGYAFIEFEHKNDMKNAYKMADGRKVEGKRVTVDVERGRTVPNWCTGPQNWASSQHLAAPGCT